MGNSTVPCLFLPFSFSTLCAMMRGAPFVLTIACGLMVFRCKSSQDGTLKSGEFVPLVEKAGFLACPQSLKTLDGYGHCVGLIPLGSAKVEGAVQPVPDIFVRCNAQMAPPQGNKYVYRYPFVSYDAETSAPIFGSPIKISPFENTLLPRFVWGRLKKGMGM